MSKKHKWKMLGGSTTWVGTETLINIDKIYNFLLSQTDAKTKSIPQFSYMHISKETGINRKQVQFACQKLAYKETPIIKITAVVYASGKGVRTAEKVKLIKKIPKKSESGQK